MMMVHPSFLAVVAIVSCVASSLVAHGHAAAAATATATATTNDRCEDATSVTTIPFSTTGDTSTATVDFPTPTNTFQNVTCGIGVESRGVWYQLLALMGDSDGFIKATLTDENENENASTNNNTRFTLALFRGQEGEGGGCVEELECVRGQEYKLENARTQPTLTWFASALEQQSSYYLHVTGVDATDAGPFTLKIEKTMMGVERPTNDQCETATAQTVVEAGSEFIWTTTGDTHGAWPHGLDNQTCSLHPTSSRGLFYQVVGTGKALSITLLLSEEDDDSSLAASRMELAVLGSSCSALECLALSDFLTAEDTPHTVTFDSEEGVTYHVAVTGEGFEDASRFELAVSEAQADDDPAMTHSMVLVTVGTFVGAITLSIASL